MFHSISKRLIEYRDGKFKKCLAGYKINSSKCQIDKLHSEVVAAAKRFESQGQDDLANELFFISFFVKGQKEPDEASYNLWVNNFSKLIFNAAKRYSIPIPYWKNKVPKIAFVGLGDDPSAYEHIYFICKHLNEGENYQPHLFLFSPNDNLNSVKARFNEIGTPVIIVNFNESAIPRSCTQMRDALHKEQIDIAVWVHLPSLMFFLFGMKIAATQVFISQYLHPDIAKFKIDGLITYGTIAEKSSIFLQDRWRVIPSAIKIIPGNNPEINIKRKRYADDNTIILATFGRIEKIRQETFLKCVAKILQQSKNTVYLYTGYEDDIKIANFFQRKGLLNRVKFVGWVDIDVFAQMIDIVLDSFPLATGLTAIKASFYGKPILSMGNNYSYMGRDIKPILEKSGFSGFAQAESVYNKIREAAFELPFTPYAQNNSDYILKAEKLVQCEKSKIQLASFQALCLEHLYFNTSLMSEVFIEQIKDIRKTII
ncbi:hypothetical protein [Runella aurantiaca]|uniref:Glycosyltransferase involved in cell wall biosynthesis n=1 Tax=Runella aurantiaca TaxID=2282308 RepID=A0A369IHJ9_9BACT|nr:hypothetical protein [Runella aurantiaca]RDB07817.1 hypothetical protein DVG78_01825 [Runella aurantiaca]